MTDFRKQKLIHLGPGIFAEALLDLATHSVEAEEYLFKRAALVSDWKGFNHHEAFKSHVYQNHGRKHSFWSKYGGKK